jgi:hypothetical protein
LLLVPAALVGKTLKDASRLCPHWHFRQPRIVSYEWLGRVQAAQALEVLAPDLIIADEAHRLKNPRAAVTRRVNRYMVNHPETKFVAMSGTITKRSIQDFAHVLRWTHKHDKRPLPRWHGELELWSDALDERKGQLRRADPGALRLLCSDEEDRLWSSDSRRAARLAFRRRLIETPGVVATGETPIDASIIVRGVEPSVSKAIDDAFAHLRAAWETPDGWPIADGLGVFRHARELALGFFYVWDPRPPAAWLAARSVWASFVRSVLSHSHKLDTELQVRRQYGETPECKAWLAVRDSFEPHTVAQWLDTSVVGFVLDWARKHAGIVWVEHTCFGQALEARGLPYYGKQGLDARGRAIEEHEPDRPLAASIASNATGRNLQTWSHNLIVSMPANGMQTEQLIGRTHRDGQEADEVTFDVLTTCAEHVGAFWQAYRDCEFVADSTGAPQKLLIADVEMPTADAVAFRSGARWNK